MSTDARCGGQCYNTGAGVSENPYEPPQTEVPAPLVPPALLSAEPEKPIDRPIFRLLAIAMGYLVLSQAMGVAWEWDAKLSLAGLRELLSIVLTFVFGLFWVGLGLTGRVPRFFDR